MFVNGLEKRNFYFSMLIFLRFSSVTPEFKTITFRSCMASVDYFTTLRSATFVLGPLGTAVISSWGVCFINIL